MFADGSGWELETGGSPLCESCGSEQAVVHLVQIHDGAVAHTHLCGRCAQQAAEQGPASMAVVFAMPAMLSGLFGNVLKPEEGRRVTSPTLDDPVCGVCGTTLEQVTESGQLGCAACYGVFAAQVEQAMAAAHDSLVYEGKSPRHMPQNIDGPREVVRLRRMLSELVDRERFEEAAGVRDRLAELGAGPTGGHAAAAAGRTARDVPGSGE